MVMQSRNTLLKKKQLDKSQTWKGGLGKMSVSVDWKPERTVQAKIKDIKKMMIILIGRKPERAIYAKVKDYNKVTASGQTWFIWGILTVKRLPTWSICKKCLLHHQLMLHVGLYPINGLILLQWYHLQWRLPSVCTTTSVHLPPHLSSLVSSSYT